MFFAKCLNKQYTAQSRVCFQLDDLSLWKGGRRKQSVREEAKGGGVFNIEKVYVYLNKLCDWRVAKVCWCFG